MRFSKLLLLSSFIGCSYNLWYFLFEGLNRSFSCFPQKMLEKGHLKIHYETFPHLKKGMCSDSMQNSRIIIIFAYHRERRERATRQANNAILVHRNNLSPI